MITSVVRLSGLVALCLMLATSFAAASASATDEILRVLPADMSGCLIIEDLGKHTDMLSNSESVQRFSEKPIVQNWKKSPAYRGLEGLAAFLPIYFGVSNDQLIHDILGESIVLALRLNTEGAPPVGVFACRAAKEEVLAKVVERLTQANPNREVTPHQYRGVTFHERHEFNGRQDFVLRLGAVAILTDKRQAIEQIINTSLDGHGLVESSLFKEMRQSIGEGAFVQLLINTRAFEPLLNGAVDSASGPVGYFASIFRDIWQDLNWAALSLRISDHIELSLHAAVDTKRLNEEENRWLTLLGEASSFWKRVPADAVFAAATKLDAAMACKQFSLLARVVPELKTVVEAFDELSVGFNATNELIPALGPELGSIIRVNESGLPEIRLELELTHGDSVGDTGLTLAKTLELVVLRPIFVFYSIEHNHEFQDTSRVETTEVDGIRIHALKNSTVLPAWLTPAFAVTIDRIQFVSSPSLLTDKKAESLAPWIESAIAKQFRSALGEDEILKAYINVGRLRDYLTSHQGEIAGGIAEKTSVSSTNASGKIEDLSSILELVDFAVLSTTTKGSVRRWTLSAFMNDTK